ncbi:methanol O-anthraniloyltransferase [Bertholletia excelsa]
MPTPTYRPFIVSRREPELVRPARPTPLETKRLSDIDDQKGLRFHVPFIMFYRNNPLMEGVDPVGLIKEALAKTLAYYYPLAGRLVEVDNRKLMVECNGERVLFLEADADEDLLYNVPESGRIVGCPLLLVQVTRLKCGGCVLAVRFNHVIGGAGGITKFLNAVAEIARGASAPSDPPVWQRHLLNAREPPRITCTHHEYAELVDNDQRSILNGQNTIIKSFFFGPKELKSHPEAPPATPQLLHLRPGDRHHMEVNVEYVRSMIDLLVARERPPFVKKWNYFASDDFGWGKPVYGGTVGISGTTVYPGSVYAGYKNSKGEEGLLVPMSLPEAAMERFQEELSKILTQEPVNSGYGTNPKIETSKL